MNKQTNKLKPLSNIHHAAYACRDADQTRWFYEEVLGLELCASFHSDMAPGSHEETPFMHLFFKLGDGNFIAFFDAPEINDPEMLEMKHSFTLHVAFEVEDEAAMLDWQESIQSKGKSCLGPVDHGFVKSVYMYDPNGIQVEITCKTDQYDGLMAKEKLEVDENFVAWNKLFRARKEQKFGAAALDKRGKKSA